MRITLSGATGFLGDHLVRRLHAAGHELRLLVRRPVTGLPPGVETFLWNPPRLDAPAEALSGADALIHLSGASVNQRWTPETKTLLRSSRIDTTRSLVHSLSTLSARPGIFLCASAVGIYGDRGDETLTEDSTPGPGFLSGLTLEWEKEANLARSLGIRVNCLRTGVVLGREGGALASMLPVFRLGIGGKLGSGQQWMSWIHVDDWTSAVAFLLGPDFPSGPFNLTAPEPARNAAFTQTLGKVLHRPAFLPVPEIALRALFGEMSAIILSSQRVLPTALEAQGYRFQHAALEPALRSLLY
jgi:uncharacterized protein (TIGR01777 family)